MAETVEDLKRIIKEKDEEIAKLKEHNQVLLKTALKQKKESMELKERVKDKL